MRLLIILTVFFALISCSNNIKVFSDEEFAAACADTTITTENILDLILPGLTIMGDSAHYDNSLQWVDKSGKTGYAYGVMDDDKYKRLLLVGRLMDNGKLVAIEIFNNGNDTSLTYGANRVRFFEQKGKHWQLLLDHDIGGLPAESISFNRLDKTNNCSQVMVSTLPNMNNNVWSQIYYCSSKDSTIHYAGSIVTHFEINPNTGRIEETYGGSGYMDETKTIYEWHNELLIPVSQIVIRKNYNWDYLFLETYNNPTMTLCGLEETGSQKWNGTKKQRQMWDNFFSQH